MSGYRYSSKRKEDLEQQNILLKIESEEADPIKPDPVKPPPVTPVTKNPVLAGDMVKEIEEKNIKMLVLLHSRANNLLFLRVFF